MGSLARPLLLRRACLQAQPRYSASTISSFYTSSWARSSQKLLSLSSSSRLPIISRSGLKGVSRIAAFHTTSRRGILPPLPQKLEGTANEPAPVPPPHPTHGSYHWTFERLVSAALIPVTIAPFAGGSLHPIMDATLCALLVIHSHIGFQSIIIDYVPKKRIPKTRTLFEWGLRAGTFVVAVGLYEFETNDVGLTEAVKRLWHA